MPDDRPIWDDDSWTPDEGKNVPDKCPPGQRPCPLGTCVPIGQACPDETLPQNEEPVYGKTSLTTESAEQEGNFTQDDTNLELQDDGTLNFDVDSRCPGQVVCDDGSCADSQENCPSSVVDNETDECTAIGFFTCPDGTCVESQMDCSPDDDGDPLDTEDGTYYDDYSMLGDEAESEFFDDPETTDIDEGLRAVYDEMGGFAWTGLSYETWVERYGDVFPEWEGSEYQEQYSILQKELGLLQADVDLTKRTAILEEEQLRWSTQQDLEDMSSSMEAAIRKAGGLQSGAREEQIQSAYDKVLQGFDFQQAEDDLKLESAMITAEEKHLGLEFDLSQTVINFEDRMWDLIGIEKEGQYGGLTACNNDADCGSDSDRKCISGACVNVHEYVRGGEETGFDYDKYLSCKEVLALEGITGSFADQQCTGAQFEGRDIDLDEVKDENTGICGGCYKVGDHCVKDKGDGKLICPPTCC